MVEKEYQIEESILEYLKYNGWFAWKNSTAGYYHPKLKRFVKHRSKYAITGVSDIIAVKNKVVLFIEVKNSTNKQTENQKTFEKNIRTHGGNYHVCRSVVDVEKLVSAV